MNSLLRRAIVLCITLIIFASCSDNTKTVNFIVLMDFSGSIPSQTMEWYKSVIKLDIIQNLESNSRIVVLPVDYGSTTNSTELFYYDLTHKSFKNNYDSPILKEKKMKQRVQVFVKNIQVEFDSVLHDVSKTRAKYSKGTDILGGLALAQRYSYPNDKNIVLVFSDMINETEELNLDKLNSNSSILKLLEKSPKVSGGFDIIVMTGEQPNIKIKEMKLLKDFWTKYFNESQLNLIAYETSSKSILVRKIIEYQQQN
ncbi:MAG: hypothetical protein COW71_06440 [Ignavibacteriales bacterium CG18_big_fil_WC_8_21_14_2_50_31_20]|nr:MAG: hypothetical protein COW71_06440 [Ignavibacteriales bacterium CG18_big_fil_WC_8_21_14_2_50_31_20]